CPSPTTMNGIKTLLQQHSKTLSPGLINATMTILACSTKTNLLCKNNLTLIDYSLPSNHKRLWVFDLKSKKLLYHTYVSHGLKSGVTAPNFFTNILNSKTSSLGVFVTEKSYYGRDGLSLKLKGLEQHFNDNASRRALVMHSAWYAEENFIRKYGRTGRSWGCPAMPLDMNDPIINAIKDESLLIIYYPNDQWFSTSSYLTCNAFLLPKKIALAPPKPMEVEARGDILFGDTNTVNKLDANVPVLAMSAENYQRIFKTLPPLVRMLRRQINNTEYIALNLKELRALDTNSDNLINEKDKEGINVLEFFLPELVNVRGYHATQFKPADIGKAVEFNLSAADPVLVTSKSKIIFKPTDKFIRWIGL
nr:murein L,D-transpeptidase catalytic domain family protein [Pseudomonadota bacterium]